MGKMDEKEMIAISIIAIIFSPFIIAGKIIKSIGVSLGLIEEEKHEYDPTMDPNYQSSNVENKTQEETIVEQKEPNKPYIYKPGEQGYTENKLDPNS